MVKRDKTYWILPSIQGVGAVVIFFEKVKLPKAISLEKAIMLIIALCFFVLLLRLLWILISSHIINISKLIYYKITGERIIATYISPFFWYNSKWSWGNIFWVYDDRTYFSLNKYLRNKNTYEQLRMYFFKRNRFLAGGYIVSSMTILGVCWFNNWLMAGWLFLFGAVEHFLYQSEYRRIGSMNGMAFAGLKSVDDRFMIHMLVNQSKMEKLDIGSEVVEIFARESFDVDGGYFFNYLCLASIYHEICDGADNMFAGYINEKIDNILNKTELAFSSVTRMKKDVQYKYIEDDVCIFYANYREFLLYILMYYHVNGQEFKYKQLNNYIRFMLEKIESQYVNNSILSQAILTQKFYEYRGLYENVINHEFEIETTVFTGYDTLPVWREQRQRFVDKYNIKKSISL